MKSYKIKILFYQKIIKDNKVFLKSTLKAGPIISFRTKIIIISLINKNIAKIINFKEIITLIDNKKRKKKLKIK